MKLFYSAASPYVRKVMACAIARGIDGRIELVPSAPAQNPPDLLAANPLAKVPCLVTDDGIGLFDSPVICEYLDSIGDAIEMFPTKPGARWRALRLQALADGILDAALIRRGELPKPLDEGRIALVERQRAAMTRGLDALEREVPHKTLDIGTITVACALGYLDFRFAAEPWRNDRPGLAAWYDAMMLNPCLAKTAPPPT